MKCGMSTRPPATNNYNVRPGVEVVFLDTNLVRKNETKKQSTKAVFCFFSLYEQYRSVSRS